MLRKEPTSKELLNELYKFKLKVCLHHDKSNSFCSKFSRAHSLQKKRILKEIIDENYKVKKFHPTTFEIVTKGWKESSIFTGYCNFHDNKIFQRLEKCEYTGTKEQKILIGFRAICWELYHKIKAVNFMVYIDKKYFSEIYSLEKENFNKKVLEFRKGVKDFIYIKDKLDFALQKKRFCDFYTYEIELAGDISVVSTGAITPNHLLNHQHIQNISDLGVRMNELAFGIDIKKSNNSFCFVFVWHKDDLVSCKFIKDIDKINNIDLPEFLIQFIFAYCENTYFSRSWWENLSDIQQSYVKALVKNTSPYIQLPEYKLQMKIAPWTFKAKNTDIKY